VNANARARARTGEDVVKPSKRWIIGVVIAGVVVAGRAPLQAQPMTDPVVTERDDRSWSVGVSRDDRHAARELFLEGNRLFRVPLFARAAEQYAAALRTWKHPAFYFNLALAQLNLGLEVEARENLVAALRHGDEPLGVEPFREAQKQLRDVERQLGQIDIRCETRGAEVTLDGVPRFIGPGRYRGWVKPRSHEITAKSPGYLADTRRVAVTAGAVTALDLRLVTLSEATEAGRRWPAWKPWAVVASGVVVGAAGGVLHALAARNFTAYDNQFGQLPCASFPGCQPGEVGPELTGQLRRARREQQFAVGGYIAGGALLAVGTALVYLNRPRLREQAPRIAIVPAVSSDLLGFLVSVRH
jgi:hypothetical protein